MKRKIIKQGNNTLTVTLPRDWTNQYNIQAGDEINLDLKGGALVLSTDSLISFDKKTKDISNLTSILPFVLLSLYRKGYDEVELKFEKEGVLIILENIIRDGSVGYHIIDHGKNYCLLKSLSDVSGMDFNEILRKLFILVKMKLERIIDAVSKGDLNGLQSIIAMNSLPSKMTNFCHRLLAKRSLGELDNLNYFQLIVSNLENLDNQLNSLLKILLNPSLSLGSNALFEVMDEFRQLYCDFYSGYYEQDFNKFVCIVNRKNQLSEKIRMNMYELNKDENQLFLNLNNSIIYFNEMINTALIMRI